MSALELAIRLLQTAGPVTAIVDIGVWPGIAPQVAAMPYVVVNLIGETDEQMLSGAGRMYETRLEIACVAGSITAANALGEAVKTALEDLTNHSVIGAGDPPADLGRVNTWKTGADVTDWSDDRSSFRRLMDFGLRWRP